MRKVISLYFIIHFLAFSLFQSQMIEMPQLVQHYNHHRFDEGEKDLSFTAFLWLHYSPNSTHRQQEDHSMLPLFHNYDYMILYNCDKQLTITSENTIAGVYLAPQSKTIYDFSNCKSIFQPPRFS